MLYGGALAAEYGKGQETSGNGNGTENSGGGSGRKLYPEGRSRLAGILSRRNTASHRCHTRRQGAPLPSAQVTICTYGASQGEVHVAIRIYFAQLRREESLRPLRTFIAPQSMLAVSERVIEAAVPPSEPEVNILQDERFATA